MLEPIVLAALAQADGLSLNTTTLAVITAMVLGLVGAIVFIFKMLTSNQARQIDKLTEERDELLDRLFDMVQRADRSTDAADEAARMLAARRGPRDRTNRS